MKSQEITELIDRIWDGVEKSKAGSIVLIQTDGAKVINNIPFQTFLHILDSFFPKVHTVEAKEPDEPWKKGR